MLHPVSAKRSVALLVSGTLVAIVAQMFVALPAKADCVTSDGVTYRTGETYGPYTCMPDGTWQ